MNQLQSIKEFVLSGGEITAETALELFNKPLEDLCKAANEIREYFCSNKFDICTIINAKSGKCSENCKYCAQSAHYNTHCDEYPLLDSQAIYDEAKYNSDRGVLRYSLVTSGKNISDAEVDKVCEATEKIRKNIPIRVCGSFGLLNQNQYEKLYNSGLTRIHNNLETSRENFSNICTTHSFEDKLTAIQNAKNAGMTVCSGGIFGVGETVEDRISLAITLRELEISSIPVNLLNAVKGTPLQDKKPLSNDEMRRIIAVYRFILPKAFIRLAGGRGLLEDKGRACFLSGANAAISGDMLTTSGISIQTDMEMLEELGFVIGVSDE